PSAWLQTGGKLEPAFDRRTSFLVSGAFVFVTGFVAFLATIGFGRYQPYEEPVPPTPELVQIQDLPMSQWDSLVAASSRGQVRAIRFESGSWRPPEVPSDIVEVPPSVPEA